MESILIAWDRNKFCAGIFCDLIRARNYVNHELMLHKLPFYGIRGVILDLFRSCLSGRKQRVKNEAYK
jgi:hypothetical protein